MNIYERKEVLNMNYTNTFSSMTDEEIAVLASAGNGEAIDYLLCKYMDFVRAKARGYFLIGADSEDIIQEGMIGLFKAVRDFKTDISPSFSAFAHLCIKRQIITAIKTATRKKHMPLNSYISLSNKVYDDDNETTLVETLIDKFEFSPEDIVINKESYKNTENKIVSLLSEYESKVLLLYLEGKPYSDIANVLGKSEKSIDNALQRIKHKIEKKVLVENSEKIDK